MLFMSVLKELADTVARLLSPMKTNVQHRYMSARNGFS